MMPGITLHEVGGQLLINVPDETTVIGRGQFLQVTDKRVSRSHALLEVMDGKLYIIPTHTNPCFLRPSSSKEQKVLERQVKQMLNHGDEFGLLPDQLFYRVSYLQLNGKDSAPEKTKEVEENKNEEKPALSQTPAKISNGESKDTEKKKKDTSASVDPAPDEDSDKVADDFSKENKGKDESNDEDDQPETPSKTLEKDSGMILKQECHGDMILPIDKKRVLPDWMKQVAGSGSSTKTKQSPKKPTSTAVSKREPGTKLTMSYTAEEEDDEEEKEVYKSGKPSKISVNSDDEFEEEVSDDNYVPEKTTSRGGRQSGKRKGRDSEEDDFSEDDDDDDYSPKRKKARTPKKGTPKKGKTRGGGKGKKRSPGRTRRKTPQRGGKQKQASDDDDEDILLPRRRGYDDDGSARRPQRAARTKRGSYVDDPMIEEALSDFASEDAEDANEDKDSDFEVEGEVDSGSDLDKLGKGSQKQASKVIRSRAPAPRRPTKRNTKKPKKRMARDDSDDEDLEDDEPYVPRPSKRRGGRKVSCDSDDSDEDKKKKRRREPCQYGKKCYRKNPVHFRTFCHPGDASYDDDEDNDSPTRKDTPKKGRDTSRASLEKPSRPQRSTAGTRLVTEGSMVDEEDLPDTYDYNDSFINDGTQRSENSDNAEDDSDYNAEEDVKGLSKEAKKFVKNKKIVTPIGKVIVPEDS